jgi:hypothetical protein
MILNNFKLEDDPLKLKNIATINSTDNTVVLTAFIHLCCT